MDMGLTNGDDIHDNRPNRPSKEKQESELPKHRVTFERASDLRDRELIERSYVQIREINQQLIHSRIEIIVRPKSKPEATPSS
jgi:hypothetical protein